MLNIIFSIVTFSLITSFHPGEAVGTLNCKSESGKTIFIATLPSCSYLETADFSIENSKYSFTHLDLNGIIFDPENKIFTVYLETKSSDPRDIKFIRFWAIPQTFKKTKTEKGEGTQFHDTYEFRAKIYGTEPRKGCDINTKTIELICTLDVQL